MKFSVTCGRAVSLPQPLHRKTQPTVMRANKGASQARYPAVCRGQSISHRTINFTGAPVASAVTVGREDRAVWRDIDGAADGRAYNPQSSGTAAIMRNSEPGSPVSSIGGRLPAADADAPITRLFESMRPDLLRFAHWLARDRSVAEDIVQETLLRAWRSRDALKDPAAVRPWLLTIVRREHARLYERKRLELVCLDDAIEHEGIPTSQGPDSELDALRGAILKLPLEYREPLIMQVLGGFSTAEIAQELNL